MWYCGRGNKRNGVGIVLKNDCVDRVIELGKISDRIISMKMELDGVALNMISVQMRHKWPVCVKKRKHSDWT